MRRLEEFALISGGFPVHRSLSELPTITATAGAVGKRRNAAHSAAMFWPAPPLGWFDAKTGGLHRHMRQSAPHKYWINHFCGAIFFCHFPGERVQPGTNRPFQAARPSNCNNKRDKVCRRTDGKLSCANWDSRSLSVRRDTHGDVSEDGKPFSEKPAEHFIRQKDK